MRIIYLPCRGGIKESFSDSRVYSSLYDLFKRVSSDYFSKENFTVCDLSLSYYCFDARFIADCYVLCTKYFNGQLYDNPQIIGYVYFGLTKSCMKIRLEKFFK